MPPSVAPIPRQNAVAVNLVVHLGQADTVQLQFIVGSGGDAHAVAAELLGLASMHMGSAEGPWSGRQQYYFYNFSAPSAGHPKGRHTQGTQLCLRDDKFSGTGRTLRKMADAAR